MTFRVTKFVFRLHIFFRTELSIKNLHVASRTTLLLAKVAATRTVLIWRLIWIFPATQGTMCPMQFTYVKSMIRSNITVIYTER